MNDLVVWPYLFRISEGLRNAALENLTAVITRMQTAVLSVVTTCGSVRRQFDAVSFSFEGAKEGNSRMSALLTTRSLLGL
jgi:hypothetical protein